MLTSLFDVAGPDVAVVALQRRDDLLQCHAVGRQTFRQGSDLILLGIAANGIDFRHARHIAQLWLDDPVLYLPQVDGGVGAAIRLPGAFLYFHSPQVDLAESGRYRPHGRRDTGRQLVPGVLYPLVHQLPCKVDVGPILEDHRYLRQTVAGQGTCLDQVGQPGHHRFDGVGHPLLGFQRGVTRSMGIDLDLDIGDVGHGVDGKLLVTEDPQRSHPENGQKDEPALLDGKANDAFKHDRSPFP